MQHQHHQPKPLLVDIDAAAAIVSFAAATVREWAYCKRPAPAGFPAAVRIEGGQRRRPTLRYRVTDLVAWVESLGACDANSNNSNSDAPMVAGLSAAPARSPRPGPGRPSKAIATRFRG